MSAGWWGGRWRGELMEGQGKEEGHEGREEQIKENESGKSPEI